MAVRATVRRVPTRTYHPDRSRARILDAAEALFVASGFEATTIRAVGQRAGVPSALLYHHFEDKAGLFLAVQRRLYTHFLEAMTGLAAAEPPTRENMSAFLGGFFDVLARHSNVLRLTSRGGIRDPRVRRLEQSTLRLLMGRGEEYLRQGIRAGVFRDVDPRALTLSLFGMLKTAFVEDGFRQAVFGERRISPAQLARIKRTILDMTLRAVFADENG